ncbi:MAG TPA: site-specific DNA-methyltransferase [Pyrinomonadaceae bacterium]|jgi:site-specific DNA-methyltransferase (adenine-specific)|nr:site-specific DNA-methyltransferase [Pyrinomonadaceae bacterium]
MTNSLYYGDNLPVLRKDIPDESVDLCYIDPPFNSKRSYQQIYNNTGSETCARSWAFTDNWVWDTQAAEGFEQIVSNPEGRFASQTVELIKGLRNVLKEGSLLAYLVSLTLRVVEIHRVLKPDGSFYLHCDPRASHYLKLLLDAVFTSQGGEFQNEIIWCYTIGGKSKKRFAEKHDVILFYTKSSNNTHTFNAQAASIARKSNSHMKVRVDAEGRKFQSKTDRKTGKVYLYPVDAGKIAEDYWTDIETLNREDKERQGYPTQKPESLLERIIGTSSNVGDVVLDAYCGCGTTIVAAERLQRAWIGIDITYQSISLTLSRLETLFGKAATARVMPSGVPRDMNSARALAHKTDDRVPNEFEKWAVLTYTNNLAIINDRKTANKGIDGIIYFPAGGSENAKIIFQVKRDGVDPSDLATLRIDMQREQAMMAILITLEKPTRRITEEAEAAGAYLHEPLGRSYDKIQLVTIQEILEQNKRLDIPTSPALRSVAAVKVQ